MNEKKWLENHYAFEHLDSIENISYFTLIWNVFENKCCNNNAKIAKHPKDISEDYQPSDDIVNNVYNYFKRRYISIDNTDTESFKQFKFTYSENKKDIVRDIFLKASPDKKEKVLALLYIAFRLRNNLYHGEKVINSLPSQNENFKQINTLLRDIIDNQY